MPMDVPFMRWTCVKNPSLNPLWLRSISCKQLEGRVICALALRDEMNRIMYRAFDTFLEDYHQILPLGGAIQWNFACPLAAWLHIILYHSFLWFSEEGVSGAWHFKVCWFRKWKESGPEPQYSYCNSRGIVIGSKETSAPEQQNFGDS